MTKTFSFSKQFEVGKAAEEEFLVSYHRPLLRYDGREHDFVDNLGNRLELKTEMRTLEETPNFYMEYFSDIHRQTKGGPWQALQKGSNVYVILFIKNKHYFVFNNIGLLCRTVTQCVKEKNLRDVIVKNTSWTSKGYAVPRDYVVTTCEAEEYKYE